MLARYLPPGALVLEIGSAIGGDAILLRNHGYRVIASDFVDGFLGHLRSQGFEPLKLDAKRDDLPSSLDGIHANAVLVHFSHEDIARFFGKASSALRAGGILFASVIEGQGSERSARARGFERNFQYCTEDEVARHLEYAGFRILHTEKAISPSRTTWIQVMASSAS